MQIHALFKVVYYQKASIGMKIPIGALVFNIEEDSYSFVEAKSLPPIEYLGSQAHLLIQLMYDKFTEGEVELRTDNLQDVLRHYFDISATEIPQIIISRPRNVINKDVKSFVEKELSPCVEGDEEYQGELDCESSKFLFALSHWMEFITDFISGDHNASANKMRRAKDITEKVLRSPGKITAYLEDAPQMDGFWIRVTVLEDRTGFTSLSLWHIKDGNGIDVDSGRMVATEKLVRDGAFWIFMSEEVPQSW